MPHARTESGDSAEFACVLAECVALAGQRDGATSALVCDKHSATPRQRGAVERRVRCTWDWRFGAGVSEPVTSTVRKESGAMDRPGTAVRGDSHGRLAHVWALTVSRSVFPGLNAGVLEAAVRMLSPVAGLRPWRVARGSGGECPEGCDDDRLVPGERLADRREHGGDHGVGRGLRYESPGRDVRDEFRFAHAVAP